MVEMLVRSADLLISVGTMASLLLVWIGVGEDA